MTELFRLRGSEGYAVRDDAEGGYRGITCRVSRGEEFPPRHF